MNLPAKNERPRFSRDNSRGGQILRCHRGGTDFVEYLCVFALIVVVVGIGVRLYGGSVRQSFDDNSERLATFDSSAGASAQRSRAEATPGGGYGSGGAAAHTQQRANAHFVVEPAGGEAGIEEGIEPLLSAVDFAIFVALALIVVAVVASVTSRIKHAVRKRKEKRLQQRAVALAKVVNTKVAANSNSSGADGQAKVPSTGAAAPGHPDSALPSMLVPM